MRNVVVDERGYCVLRDASETEVGPRVPGQIRIVVVDPEAFIVEFDADKKGQLKVYSGPVLVDHIAYVGDEHGYLCRYTTSNASMVLEDGDTV